MNMPANASDRLAAGQTKSRHYNAIWIVAKTNPSPLHQHQTTYVQIGLEIILKKPIFGRNWGTRANLR